MAQYFENDDTLKSEETIKKVVINNKNYNFTTDNGVFSKKGLDFGTRTLLETININEIHGKVLDFGCGYGPIGIYIAQNTDAEVHMIDINRRSLELARKNVNLNHVNVKIFESDIYQNISELYDYIISNPPIRVGKEILYKILFEAKKHLNKNGQLWIVINKNQGAKSVLKDLAEKYDVELITKNKGFYIICAKNN
ncbi:MAG: class I SAM-dependent methyltransferase [Bacilli bacterium]|nr:class I SAM-dependent methyltransferase [Bacilli bacterium]